MRSSSSEHRGARAFTLVELLVVIGIIALLISILLPTLGKARAQAMTTQCMSNLRQIGIAYRFYAEGNRGYLPYIRNHVWQPASPSVPAGSLYWYKALAPYIMKSYDPFAVDANEKIPKVVGACPAWSQWQDANDVSNNWRPGYGQNLYLFRGSGTKVVGSRGITIDGDSANVGIDGQSEGSNESYCLGIVKLASLRNPAARILAGDAVQYWMGVSHDGGNGVLADKTLRYDFSKQGQEGPPGDTTASVFDTVKWTSGHPNRHGGLWQDCRFDGTGSKATAAKANYLFADGHVNTLGYLEARRALQAPR